MHEGTVTAEPRTQVIIKRPRLTKILDDSRARLLLLVAPAGYGKTTLAREWTEGKERVGWYSGGPGMMDVAGLSVGIAEVLASMGEPAREDMVERVRILAAHGHTPRGLAKAVSACAPEADWLLVVDDYHHAIGSEESETFFEELVALTRFPLLLTSRERPAWFAARRIVYGEADVVEMNALAFTDDEAREILGSNDERVLGDARGWPAVIGLAARRSASDVTSGLPPDALYRFFAEDLLQQVDPLLQDALFLLALVGEAAEASLADLLGWSHQAIMSAATERGFLSRGESRTMHPLLRGFLFSKLRERGDRDRGPLITSAFEFLAARDRWDDCLVILREFPEKDLIHATLVRGLGPSLESGRVTRVSELLDLAKTAGVDTPLIDLAEAELAFRKGHNRRALTLGLQAATRLEGDLAARAYLTAARAAHQIDDYSETYRLAELGGAKAASDWLREDAVWIEFSAALEQEGGAELDDVLGRLLSVIGKTGSPRSLLANAFVAIRSGHVFDAVRELETASELSSRGADPFVRTSVLHQLAYARAVTGTYELAVETNEQLIREATEVGLEFVIDHGLLGQAGALIGMRKLAQAKAVLAQLDRRSTDSSVFVLENVALQKVRLAITVGDLNRASVLLSALTSKRHALYGEIRAYTAMVSVGLGDLDAARALLVDDGKSFGFSDSRALRVIGLAMIELIRFGRTPKAVAMIETLFTRGEADAIVMAIAHGPDW